MKVVNKNKVLIIGIISLILVNMGLLIYHKYTDKETNIPKIKLKDQEEEKDTFAIMLEQDDGTYQATESTSFNQPGYKFNSSKSNCIDINGNKIDGILSYDNNTKAVGVTSNKTVYCYVYFDIDNSGAMQLINSGKLWQSGLEGDGYRYYGRFPDNYICFGTKDKDTCTRYTEDYMYRIIGVFPDSYGNQHMKLIKKEALTNAMQWNSNSSTDVNWGSSTLFSAINGSTYLTNTTYMPSGWSSRITNWTWSAVNTVSSGFNTSSSGPDYYNIITKEIYLHELNRSGKPSGGKWTSPKKQIGLMYASDYQLSLGSGYNVLNYKGYLDQKTLLDGWMHLSNNDSNQPSPDEWTMSRSGKDTSDSYRAWTVEATGGVNDEGVYVKQSVRPVFYLNTDQVISSGSGTLSDPYILS